MMVPDPATRFSRQLDLLPLDRLDVPITVIGAGAVGSFVTLTLAKMGLRDLTVFDDDVVDVHNVANQFYRLTDIGRPKVAALADLVRDFEAVQIDGRMQRFAGGHLGGIVVSAVDSMASRRTIWDAVSLAPGVQLFVDARMGGQVSVTFTTRPFGSGARTYEASLHSDEEAVPEPCTARAILFTVLALSSTVARLVRLHLVGADVPPRIVQDHVLGLQLSS